MSCGEFLTSGGAVGRHQQILIVDYPFFAAMPALSSTSKPESLSWRKEHIWRNFSGQPIGRKLRFCLTANAGKVWHWRDCVERLMRDHIGA